MQRRVTAGVGVAGAAVLVFASGCSGGEKGDGVTVGDTAEAGAPQVTVTPGNGEGRALPERGVQVSVAGGTLQQVTVTRKGKPVTGQLTADKTGWKSRTLLPGSQYDVSATATSPKGKTTTVTARFKTIKAANELRVVDVTPSANEKVGVGMPVQVTFNRPVGDKKAVESALRITSDKPATGAWYWVGDTQVVFRTENGKYWQPNQRVRLRAEIGGVKSGKRTYGAADFGRTFRIGDEHIINANTKTHRLTVRKNGVKVKSWGISAGRGGRVVNGVDTYLTTSGVHLTMGKENPAIMTSEWMGVDPDDKKNGGYKEVIPFAVRISNSGEYIHSMAATVWAQGHQNVSHGCLNSPPSAAQWFYNFSYRGDPVIIKGTSRKLQWDNGWSFYQMPWSKWVKGSALGRTVTTG